MMRMEAPALRIVWSSETFLDVSQSPLQDKEAEFASAAMELLLERLNSERPSWTECWTAMRRLKTPVEVDVSRKAEKEELAAKKK